MFIILGQEQDAPGGRFSSAESFRGQLTRLNIWTRFLTEVEINQAMNSCLQMSGDLVTWSDFYPGIHGFIQVNDLTPCTGCTALDSPNHGHVTILNNNRQSSSSSVFVNRPIFFFNFLLLPGSALINDQSLFDFNKKRPFDKAT